MGHPAILGFFVIILFILYSIPYFILISVLLSLTIGVYHKERYTKLSIVGGTVRGGGGPGRGSAADTGGPSSD